jgi:predicted GIY-YIG superfamily endonuclease
MYIYIIQCENNKYYVGRTKDYNNRFTQHINNQGSVWTRIHKPIKLLKIIPCHDPFDEDKYTKMYMSKYGIDNVRGGSYTTINIDNNIKKFIEKEIITANNLCYICKKSGHYAFKCSRKFLKLDSTYNSFINRLYQILYRISECFNPYIRIHSRF